MANGVIKSLHLDKGFGFIRGEDNKEYFVHRSAIRNGVFEELGVGMPVTFEPTDSQKGPRAENVSVQHGG